MKLKISKKKSLISSTKGEKNSPNSLELNEIWGEGVLFMKLGRASHVARGGGGSYKFCLLIQYKIYKKKIKL